MKAFLRSFVFAFKGILHCIKSERNMRFHFCAAFYVLIFMRFFDLTSGKKAAVYIVIALVISLELINTAIEALTDMVSPQRSEPARIAKDCAAGAVLAAAVGAVCVAVCVFDDIDGYIKIYEFFADKPLMLVPLAASVVGCGAFVFGKRKDTKND